MLAGFLSSTFMNSAHTLGVDMVNLSPAPFSPSFSYEYRVASAGLLALFICTLAVHQKVWPSFLPYVLEVFSGFSFGCGLFIGGMTRPAKVASFLTISSTLFDPTLLFVMVGGIAVALPGFQFAMYRQKKAPSSRSFLDRPIDIPSNKTIDRELIAGAIMFGSGWGLLGICPGPALVALGTLQPRIVVFCVTYAASYLFHEFVQPRVMSLFKKDLVA